MERKFSVEMQEMVEAFGVFNDWENKYAYLIDLGRQLMPLGEEYKVQQNIVQGCASKVWLISVPNEQEPDKYFFKADSDAHIVKGLLAILMKVYSGKTKQQIEQVNIVQFFNALGLAKHLSSNRSNGFFAVNKAILSHLLSFSPDCGCLGA
jgi:cysteine desulfuration protein SufE